jgi:hypothetical protein
MAARGGIGEEIIGRVASGLGCNPNQITFWRHGLTWYPGGLTQHVWTEEVSREAPLPAWRVQVRTWCLKRVVASSNEMIAAIGAELPLNSIGALIRKPGSPSRLGLGASMWLSADRVDWTSKLMASVARLQAGDALRLAQARPVVDSGAAPDVANSQLAIEGMAAPVPHVPEPEVLTSGSIEALPFLEMADVMRAHDGVRAIATHSGITASVPWALDAESEDFILLEMRVATREPLGAGLWISMSLPMSTPAHLMHALTLNEAELATSSPTDLVGGWLVRNQTLMHESFIPWALCSGPLIRHLAESAARRANWLRQIGPSVLPGEWPDEIRGRVLPFRRMP